MAIFSTGVDLVGVKRIGDMIERHGEHFLSRIFTPGERRYCEGGKRRDEHYAARFAAKEAVLKALGTGWRDGISWTDVEVAVELSGRPIIRLSGRASEIAIAEGIAQFHISLSHAEGFAIASVVAETG
jgi:holo-[acyl-carrier protein] synthase